MSPKGADTVRLTKHEHACVVLEKDGATFVVDPGVFSPGAADIIAGAEAILLTHEHFDHVNEAAISEALAARPDLRVYAPAAMAACSPRTPASSPPSARATTLTVAIFGDHGARRRPRDHPPGHPHASRTSAT